MAFFMALSAKAYSAVSFSRAAFLIVHSGGASGGAAGGTAVDAAGGTAGGAAGGVARLLLDCSSIAPQLLLDCSLFDL